MIFSTVAWVAGEARAKSTCANMLAGQVCGRGAPRFEEAPEFDASKPRGLPKTERPRHPFDEHSRARSFGCFVIRIFSSANWLILALIAAVSGTAFAQTAKPEANGASAIVRQDVSRTMIQNLRDGNIEDAFKLLGSVTDGVASEILVDEEGLSQVSGGLHRALSQLSSEAQFDLLSKWSMPAESPPKIRVLTILVPTLAPPTEFARALGERPRNMSFPVSSIGEIRGIFCKRLVFGCCRQGIRSS